MRIVVDPESLQGTAARLDDASSALQAIAAQLVREPLPAMPAGLASTTTTILEAASGGIRGGAQDFFEIAGELRLRAMAANLGAPWEAIVRAYLTANDRYNRAIDALGPFDGLKNIGEGLGAIVTARLTRQILGDVDALGAARLRFGDSSLEVVSAWERLQARVSVFTSLDKNPQALDELFAGGGRTTAAVKKLLEPVESSFGLGKVGKVLGAADTVFKPLAIASNVAIVVGPGRYNNPWRNGIDKAFAAASTYAIVAGPEAEGAILLAQGAWEVGNWAYDHRQEIAHDTVAVAKATWHGVDEGYHAAEHLVSGVQHTVGDVEDHAKHAVGNFIHHPFGL